MYNSWQQRLQRMFLLDFQPVRFVRIGQHFTTKL
nr:MAG TPA: hypothetical protein [Caudoviricetes sp.]